MVKKIIKRDGRIVPFDQTKILNAISKAVERSEEEVKIGELTDEVVSLLNKSIKMKLQQLNKLKILLKIF